MIQVIITDSVRLSINELIQEKLKKKEDIVSPDKKQEDITDLMEALQASIDKGKSTYSQEKKRKKQTKKIT